MRLERRPSAWMLGAAVACSVVGVALVATVPDWQGNSLSRECSVGLAGGVLIAAPLLLIVNGVIWTVMASRVGPILAATGSAMITGVAVFAAIAAADRCSNVSVPPLQVIPPAPEVHSLGPGPSASECGAASDRRIAAGSWSACDELRFGFAVDSFGNELDDLVVNIQVCYPVIEGEGVTIYPRARGVERCLSAASAGLDAAYAKAVPALDRYLPEAAGRCRDAVQRFTGDVLESDADAVLARRKAAGGDVRGSYADATRLLNRYGVFELDRVNIQSACITR